MYCCSPPAVFRDSFDPLVEAECGPGAGRGARVGMLFPLLPAFPSTLCEAEAVSHVPIASGARMAAKTATKYRCSVLQYPTVPAVFVRGSGRNKAFIVARNPRNASFLAGVKDHVMLNQDHVVETVHNMLQ